MGARSVGEIIRSLILIHEVLTPEKWLAMWSTCDVRSSWKGHEHDHFIP